MCEICHQSFLHTMLKIADEYAGIKGIKVKKLEDIKEFMKTDEFIKYAEKRIPEIVKETPIFKVIEYEDGKIKNITYE